MKSCSYCNGTSPINAKFCINCGALFQANVGSTYKLVPEHIPINDIHSSNKEEIFAGYTEYGPSFVTRRVASNDWATLIINGHFEYYQRRYYTLEQLKLRIQTDKDFVGIEKGGFLYYKDIEYTIY